MADEIEPYTPKGIDALECVESQEWTFGLDNTGTRFSDDADYEIELSDGSTLAFSQTPTGGWTTQISQWAASIQAVADAAGLAWFVDARFRWPNNPSDLGGGGGLPGPPSDQVSQQLTNMLFRYVNIQICPGTPVPVRMIRTRSVEGRPVPYDLTTDGPVLGPLEQYWLCVRKGGGLEWYAADAETELEPGQIPNCWLPCGTIQLMEDPPGATCAFVFDIGCDQAGVDPQAQITRRAKFCDGEQVAVEFFVEDPTDPQALIEYDMLGAFVDCDSGEVVVTPPDEKPCTLDDLAGDCGSTDECEQVGQITDTNNGVGAGNGATSHTIKHAPTTQATTTQIKAWLDAGCVVVMEFATSGLVSVVDTAGFFSATSITFTASHPIPVDDPCGLYSQVNVVAGVQGEPVTYTAYKVTALGDLDGEKVLKTQITCQTAPLEVTVVDPPEPEKVIESNLIAYCDDVLGDGSDIVVFYRTQTLCYEGGQLASQTLSDPYDDALDPYTPTNEVVCDPQVLDADPEPYCDNGTNFIRYTLALNGAVVIVVDVEPDLTTPYTVVGPVTPGVCPLFEQTADVEVCGTKGTAIVNSGRAGISDPSSTDFTLGSIGPVDTFAELQVAAAEAGYSLQEEPYILPDGTIVSDAGLLCVTGTPEVYTFGYTGRLGTVAVNLQWEERYAQLTKGCKDDEILAKLCDIEASLNCASVCPEIDQGDSFQFDADGNPLPFPVTFPHQTAPGSVEDHTTAFSITDPKGCLALADPAALVPVRFYFKCHDLITGSNGTSGINLVIGPTGTLAALTGDSATNTFDNTPNLGGATAGVGTDLGALDKADRWVEFDVPLGELLAGMTATTSAFGSVNASVTEYLGDFIIYTPNADWAALGCEGC